MSEDFDQRAELKALRRDVMMLRNGVFGLVGIGIGALIMVGVYKERVDVTVRELSTLTVTVQQVQLQVAEMRAERLP